MAAGAGAPQLKPYLETLIRGAELGEDEAYAACCAIASGKAVPEQVSALLVLLARKGESSGEIAGFARAMRERVTPVSVLDEDCPAGGVAGGPIVDVVGTGGDGHNTLNISTTAAILAAGCGARVAKHGSVSVSSLSGSADVLQRLGVRMLPAAGIAPCIRECGIAFMFAPLFHPAMRHVSPVRRALGVRTVFNVLGPLLNPAGAKRLMLGVYSEALLETFGSALASLGGVEHAMVVHCQGLDELAPTGDALAVEVRGSELTRTTIDTVAIAGPSCTIEDLRGGTPEENAGAVRALLAGGDAAADGPVGRTVALNAGAALYVAGRAGSVQEGFLQAREALRGGKGLEALDRWAEASRTIEAAAE